MRKARKRAIVAGLLTLRAAHGITTPPDRATVRAACRNYCQYRAGRPQGHQGPRPDQAEMTVYRVAHRPPRPRRIEQ